MADEVETVMASLPTPDIVLAVATGPDGVIEGRRVRRFVDLTTGAVMAKRIFAALAAKNIVQIDCPVSGGVTGAAKGTLALMVPAPRGGQRSCRCCLPSARPSSSASAGRRADHEVQQLRPPRL